jgi:hypothetical protein
MIYLDFFSGSHGHFLEYVINTWIFKGPRVDNIFTELGTCHRIRRNAAYEANKIVTAAHYSEFNIDCVDPHKIIRINIDDDWVNWIYQINVMARAGDIPLEKKLSLTPSKVRSTPNKIRNEWYARFNSQENGYWRPTVWRWLQLPAFDFSMKTLFDPVSFYNELYSLSKFLEITFVPDHELYQLLVQFQNLNHGWQYYAKCKYIADQILAGNMIEFDSDEISQALINSMLTKCVGIFDGELFDSDQYPENTAQIWNCVDHHLSTFDQRF